jgi:hypothetical protein
VDAALFRNEERTALIESLENMLRPLMPVLLRYGVTLQDAHDALRSLYIDELSTRSRQQGRPLTDTRLGMLAGINRGEIQKLLGDREEKERLRQEKARRIEQASAVISAWHSDKRFTTPYGAPLDLSLETEQGFRTFGQLVEGVLPVADPQEVLETMTSTGCVEVHSGKFVRCSSRTLIVGAENLARIARLGSHVSDLVDTVVHNLTSQSESEVLLEQRLETSCRVTPQFSEEIAAYFRERSMSFLQECDTWVSEREQVNALTEGKRVGLGLFYFQKL